MSITVKVHVLQRASGRESTAARARWPVMTTGNSVHFSMMNKVVRSKTAAKFTMVLMPSHAQEFAGFCFVPSLQVWASCTFASLP